MFETINALSKELTAAVNLDDVLNVVISKLGQTFECDVVILLPEDQGLTLRASTNSLTLDQK